ncbi:MAG: HlyD family efflux transporter periplasmic adaptor subunit [Bacteroidales bacterium]|nr:HlyD family efflux transporter periplasmic adaptor subunit [Bacteroidales bacterium]MCB9013507.1 HlyD family efflux transporter periplasmic adaptor subunit [Bacteroidales bacterium]
MSGMDRVIEKKKGFNRKTLWILLFSFVFILMAYNILFGDKSSKLNVEKNKISIEGVKRDIFQDYIAVQGVVEPIQTIFLDAVEGGRVEQILKEEGSMLKKGEPIIRLSNNNLILEISNNEAAVARAVSELRNARLQMDQQVLNSNIQILQLSKQVNKERRAYEKNEILFKEDHISPEEFQQSKEDFMTSEKLLELYRENHVKDSVYRGIQVGTLEESVSRMTVNMDLTRKRLDNLNIKAPVDGELASLNPEVGEVVSYGTRIGTMNILDSYKLRVEIDEHYISRIERGLIGICDFSNSSYQAKLTKIYPEVRNGRFAVDMIFTREVPPQIRIGQTSRIKLELGESQNAVLLSKGGFYQSTGGQWVYVVDPSGEFAIKRNISIGRQNPKYYEVLDGLSEGENVIISSYDNFGNADKLILK